MDNKQVKEEKAEKGAGVERFTSVILRDDEEVNASPRVRNLIRNWERKLPMGESTNIVRFRASAVAAPGNLSAQAAEPAAVQSKAEASSF